MITEPINYIRRDDHSVTWVAGTNTKVIEIVMDHVAYGWDGEEIHAAHPHLTLAQIHAALSYYYDHKFEIDDQVQRLMDEYYRTRSESSDQPHRSDLLNRIANP